MSSIKSLGILSTGRTRYYGSMFELDGWVGSPEKDSMTTVDRSPENASKEKLTAG